MTTGRINQVTIRSYPKLKNKKREQASTLLLFFENKYSNSSKFEQNISQSAQSEHIFKVVSKL